MSNMIWRNCIRIRCGSDNWWIWRQKEDFLRRPRYSRKIRNSCQACNHKGGR